MRIPCLLLLFGLCESVLFDVCFFRRRDGLAAKFSGFSLRRRGGNGDGLSCYLRGLLAEDSSVQVHILSSEGLFEMNTNFLDASTSQHLDISDKHGYSIVPSSISIHAGPYDCNFSIQSDISVGFGDGGTVLDVLLSQRVTGGAASGYSGHAFTDLNTAANTITVYLTLTEQSQGGTAMLVNLITQQTIQRLDFQGSSFLFRGLSASEWIAVERRHVAVWVQRDAGSDMLGFDINPFAAAVFSPSPVTLLEMAAVSSPRAQLAATAPFVLARAATPPVASILGSTTLSLRAQTLVQNASSFDYADTPELQFSTAVRFDASHTEVYAYSAAVLDVNNHRPRVVEVSQLALFENNAPGTRIGTVVVADRDTSFDDVTLSLSCGHFLAVGLPVRSADNATLLSFDLLNTAPLDRETTPSIDCGMTVADTVGDGEGINVTIIVLDLNDNAPLFGAPADCTQSGACTTRVDIEETTPVGSTILSVPVADADAEQNAAISAQLQPDAAPLCFEDAWQYVHVLLDSASHALVLTLSASLDFETTPLLFACVRVRDEGQPSLFRDIVVRVQVINVGLGVDVTWASDKIPYNGTTYTRVPFPVLQLSSNQESSATGLEMSYVFNDGAEKSDCVMSAWHGLTECVAATGTPLPMVGGVACRADPTLAAGTVLHVRFVEQLRDIGGRGKDCPRVDARVYADTPLPFGSIYSIRNVTCGAQLCSQLQDPASIPHVDGISVDTLAQYWDNMLTSEALPRNGYLRNNADLDGWRSTSGTWQATLFGTEWIQDLLLESSREPETAWVPCPSLQDCIAVPLQSLTDGEQALQLRIAALDDVIFSRGVSFVKIPSSSSSFSITLKATSLSISGDVISLEVLPSMDLEGYDCTHDDVMCKPQRVPGTILACTLQLNSNHVVATLDNSLVAKQRMAQRGAHSFRVGGLTQGSNVIAAVCTLSAGVTLHAEGVLTHVVDTQPPLVMLTEWPSAFRVATPTVNVTLGSNEPLGSVQCSVDGSSRFACGHIDNVRLTSHVGVTLEHGEHHVAVYAADLTGNMIATPLVVHVMVDLLAPVAALRGLPPDLYTHVGDITATTSTASLRVQSDEQLTGVQCRTLQLSVSDSLSACCQYVSATCQQQCSSGTLFTQELLDSVYSLQTEQALSCFGSVRELTSSFRQYLTCSRSVSRQHSRTDVTMPYADCSFPLPLTTLQHGDVLIVELIAQDQVGNQMSAAAPYRLQYLVDLQAQPRGVVQKLASLASQLAPSISAPTCPEISSNLVGTTVLAGILLGLTLVGFLITWLTFDTPAKSEALEGAKAIAPRRADINEKLALEQALELIHMSDMSVEPSNDVDYLEVQESGTDFGLSTFRALHEARNDYVDYRRDDSDSEYSDDDADV